MDTPINPLKHMFLWVGYQLDRLPWLASPLSVLIAGIGGGLFSRSGLLMLAGLGLLLLAAGVQTSVTYWRHTNDKAEDIAEARERVMDDCLIPLLEALHPIPSQTKDDRRKAVEVLAQKTAAGLREAFLAVQDVRVIVFEVSDDGQKMTHVAKQGRGDKPKPFVRGTVRGDKAFATLGAPDNFVFAPELSKSEPGEWEGSGSGYDTFISAPIRGVSEAYGMLTIDAPKAGDLDARDGATVAVFATALGVAYAEATR